MVIYIRYCFYIMTFSKFFLNLVNSWREEILNVVDFNFEINMSYSEIKEKVSVCWKFSIENFQKWV